MTDVRLYFNQECYGLRNCLHCQNIIAYSLRQLKAEADLAVPVRELSRFKKFIYQSICRENFFCENALSMEEIKEYLDNLMNGQDTLPIIEYDFSPEH